MRRPKTFPAKEREQRILDVRTYSPKPTDIVRSWYVVDADGLVLGRLATEVARILRGKHKAMYSPNTDTGDHVIVVNAAKIVMSGKTEEKLAYRHSGYPGGLSSTSYATLLARRPTEVIRKAVRGMLPIGALGHVMLGKLKVYAGPEHPHQAQSPVALSLDGARRAS